MAEQGTQELVGSPTPPTTVVVERGPVSNFATAVTDENAIYQDPREAEAHGFDHIPAPPTWGFAMGHWGKFPEQQPKGASDESPIMHAIGALMKQGGMVLHGEQEFFYHRAMEVGDRLTSSGEIKDVYTKEGSSTMTFVVTEEEWRDTSDELVLTTRMTLLHRA